MPSNITATSFFIHVLFRSWAGWDRQTKISFDAMYNPPPRILCYTLIPLQSSTLQWNERIVSVWGKIVLATEVFMPAKCLTVQCHIYFIHFRDLIAHDFPPITDAKLLSQIVSTRQASFIWYIAQSSFFSAPKAAPENVRAFLDHAHIFPELQLLSNLFSCYLPRSSSVLSFFTWAIERFRCNCSSYNPPTVTKCLKELVFHLVF